MSEVNTYLAFDYGQKYIGVAIGYSPLNIIKPLVQLISKNKKQLLDEVANLIKEYSPNKIIVGLPLNMDNTEQLITKQAKNFAAKIQNKFTITTVLIDERLTTTEAKEILFQKGGYKKLKKSNIDNLSACIILESYLENLK